MKRDFKTYENLAEKFKSIVHPVRLAILDLLCNCGADRLTVKSAGIKVECTLYFPVVFFHLLNLYKRIDFIQINI